MASAVLSPDVLPAMISIAFAAVAGTAVAAVLLVLGRYGDHVEGLGRFGFLLLSPTGFLVVALGAVTSAGLLVVAASLVVVGLCLGVEWRSDRRVPTVVPAGTVAVLPLVVPLALLLESDGGGQAVEVGLLAALVGTYLGGLVVAAVRSDGNRLPSVVAGCGGTVAVVTLTAALVITDLSVVLFFAELALFTLTLLALAAFGWYTDEPGRRHLLAMGTVCTPVLAVAPVASRTGPGLVALLLVYVLVLGAAIPGLYLYGRACREERSPTVSVL